MIELDEEEVSPPVVPPPAAAAEPVDTLLEAARSSQPARRGLGTKRALYHRVARTRSLLTAWQQAGKFLNDPKRKLSRPTEAREFMDGLAAIRRLLENFPPLLGEAGQPGYLVVALARQQVIVPTFQTLLPSQREALCAGLGLRPQTADGTRNSCATNCAACVTRHPWVASSALPAPSSTNIPAACCCCWPCSPWPWPCGANSSEPHRSLSSNAQPGPSLACLLHVNSFS